MINLVFTLSNHGAPTIVPGSVPDPEDITVNDPFYSNRRRQAIQKYQQICAPLRINTH